MDGLAGAKNVFERASGNRVKGPASFVKFNQRGRHANVCDQSNGVVFAQEHLAKLGLANPECIFQHCTEHRLELAWRTGYDLEHLRGRGLLLQRLAQLVEQAGVLDGDDGLGGEILNQIGLLGGEGADFMPIDEERADQSGLLDDRDVKGGANPAEIWIMPPNLIVCRFRPDIGYLYGLTRLLKSGEPGSRYASKARDAISVPFGMTPDSCATEAGPVIKRKGTDLGATQTRRIFDHCFEDWIKFARRRADNLQHLGGRRLLLQRLGQALSRVREPALAFFELLFQIATALTLS